MEGVGCGPELGPREAGYAVEKERGRTRVPGADGPVGRVRAQKRIAARRGEGKARGAECQSLPEITAGKRNLAGLRGRGGRRAQRGVTTGHRDAEKSVSEVRL